MKTWSWALALLLASGAACAQNLVMGVSEGTSGGLDHAQVIVKYQGLANAIGKAIKQPVNVVFIREFHELEEGMKAARFDFVLARPSDYPARGLRDYGYRFVASAKPDGQCFIIVPKDSPAKTLADIKGKRIALPEKVAYMTRFCQAELRERGINLAQENVQYVREQGAVAFYLDNKFADVGGVASYSGVATKWEKDGKRVLHKSVPQPYFPLIASKRTTPAQVDAIQKALLALPTSEGGPAVMQSIGVKEFDITTEQRLRDLLKFLGASAGG